MQLIFTLQTKGTFTPKYVYLSSDDVSILTPCLDETVRTYATSKELNKNDISLNFQNINKAVINL